MKCLIRLFTLAAIAAFSFSILQSPAFAQGVKRVVVVKVDGLPPATLDKFARQQDARTGKSLLPWIDHIFYERGTRLANFYARGMSLSAPSWSLLDTGQHLQIKGNVEFDRYTLSSYDYLNFFPFYLNYALSRRVDMPGTEVLDKLGQPLMLDAFPYTDRHQSFQLFQRGARWTTLQRGLQNQVTSRTPRQLFDEWTIGFDVHSVLVERLERELIEKLQNPRVRYLDFYTTDFDHIAHNTSDKQAQLNSLRAVDAVIGRVWTAIGRTPLASETALVIVSDHGINSVEGVYSQGYNLVKLLAGTDGGAHHVVTKRRLLQDYAVKGFYPLTPLITTVAPDSFYLKNQSNDYPTAVLDFDGNERASIHLRDGDLNLLHILFQQLAGNKLDAKRRSAATTAFFATIDRRRPEWQANLDGLREELAALRRWTEQQQTLFAAQPEKWTLADRDAGRDQEARRIDARARIAQLENSSYIEYARALENLLSLRRDDFDPARLKVEDLFARRSMGEHNQLRQLQNYVVGLAPGGLALAPDGALDFERSFRRVDYFALLRDAAVRNNPQRAVGNRPVDFVAVRVERAALAKQLGDELSPDEDAIWLYGGAERQILVLARRDRTTNELSLRYLPIALMKQDSGNQISFTRTDWDKNFPLKIYEDTMLQLPLGTERAEWLNKWHTETEWLRALYRCRYANALIGVHEQLARHRVEHLNPQAAGLSTDERLLRRFKLRQRQLAETDLLILANDHWNFDVKGFNPGGNHGSFFRISTHSVLMFAGGEQTGIPRGLSIAEPYDSLSFAPTVFTLTGDLQHNQLSPNLREQGFQAFPGRVIEELFPNPKNQSPVESGITADALSR